MPRQQGTSLGRRRILHCASNARGLWLRTVGEALGGGRMNWDAIGLGLIIGGVMMVISALVRLNI